MDEWMKRWMDYEQYVSGVSPLDRSAGVVDDEPRGGAVRPEDAPLARLRVEGVEPQRPCR
jgi:hypothetical protein